MKNSGLADGFPSELIIWSHYNFVFCNFFTEMFLLVALPAEKSLMKTRLDLLGGMPDNVIKALVSVCQKHAAVKIICELTGAIQKISS